MRPFEVVLILLPLLILALGLGAPSTGKTRARLALAGLTGLALVAQLGLEGYRWQMLPAYLISADVALTTAMFARRPYSPPRIIALLGRSVAVLGLLISGFLGWAFPVPDLPPPTGAFKVGTSSVYLKDESREESYTDLAGDRREIMAQVWYPAAPAAEARPMRWLSNAPIIGPAIARWVNLPDFLFDHINLINSNSYLEAPMAGAGSFPVLLYSHGWGGFRQINQNQVEQLASQGYIVVAVDHSYGAMVTEMPDGRVIDNKRSILPPGGSPNFAESFAGLVGVYASDLRFTLDQLERANAGDGPFGKRLAGRLDLSRVGMFGHSTGGAAVFQACGSDPRCKAVIGQDPVTTGVEAALVSRGLTQPSLTFYSKDYLGSASDTRLAAMLRAGKADGYRIAIPTAAHYDFVLTPFFSPLAEAIRLKGPIPGERIVGLLDAYQVAFFDQYLRGKPSALLTGESRPYPEATFEKVK
jgi:dienelactone hydrolase